MNGLATTQVADTAATGPRVCHRPVTSTLLVGVDAEVGVQVVLALGRGTVGGVSDAGRAAGLKGAARNRSFHASWRTAAPRTRRPEPVSCWSAEVSSAAPPSSTGRDPLEIEDGPRRRAHVI